MLRKNEQNLRQAMLQVCNIVWGEWGILNTLLKIPIFVTDCSIYLAQRDQNRTSYFSFVDYNQNS